MKGEFQINERAARIFGITPTSGHMLCSIRLGNSQPGEVP